MRSVSDKVKKFIILTTDDEMTIEWKTRIPILLKILEILTPVKSKNINGTTMECIIVLGHQGCHAWSLTLLTDKSWWLSLIPFQCYPFYCHKPTCTVEHCKVLLLGRPGVNIKKTFNQVKLFSFHGNTIILYYKKILPQQLHCNGNKLPFYFYNTEGD